MFSEFVIKNRGDKGIPRDREQSPYAAFGKEEKAGFPKGVHL